MISFHENMCLLINKVWKGNILIKGLKIHTTSVQQNSVSWIPQVLLYIGKFTVFWDVTLCKLVGRY
jgi:hypothetical protein